jgi:hypothetical protein
MLTNREWVRWYRGLLIGGVIIFALVLFFWLSGEFDTSFALLIGIASGAFIWQGYRGIQSYSSERD